MGTPEGSSPAEVGFVVRLPPSEIVRRLADAVDPVSGCLSP